MVRAGVVKHPSEWSQSGFNEIQSPPERYQMIDQKKRGQLLGVNSKTRLTEHHLSWVEGALLQNQLSRDDK
jgi:putative transposase